MPPFFFLAKDVTQKLSSKLELSTKIERVKQAVNKRLTNLENEWHEELAKLYGYFEVLQNELEMQGVSTETISNPQQLTLKVQSCLVSYHKELQNHQKAKDQIVELAQKLNKKGQNLTFARALRLLEDVEMYLDSQTRQLQDLRAQLEERNEWFLTWDHLTWEAENKGYGSLEELIAAAPHKAQ